MVKALEHFLEVCDILGTQVYGDGGQCNLLQLLVMLEFFERFKVNSVEPLTAHEPALTSSVLLDPLMLERLFGL